MLISHLPINTATDAGDHDILHPGPRLREYVLALRVHPSGGEGERAVHVRGGDAAAQPRGHCAAMEEVFWDGSAGQTFTNVDGVRGLVFGRNIKFKGCNIMFKIQV